MNTSHRSIPSVYLVTAHGRQQLKSDGRERVIDLLTRHQVPWSAVSIYAVPRAGGEPKLRPCLDLELTAMEDVAELLLYFNRNVNPFIFSLTEFKTVRSDNPASAATEYFYERLDNANASAEPLLKKLSPDECKTAIALRVADTIKTVLPKGADLVVGVSGGGDSNALLYGLSRLQEEHGLRIHPVILKGIPDWDVGVPRAQALADAYGLKLRVMEEREVKTLLGIPEDSASLIDRFQKEFEGDDFEFVGTLLIRLALFKYASEVGTPFVATGLNLEDVACEAMFRLSSGMKAAGLPSRKIGDHTLVFPLWLCPKRIIDGCFPKYSLDNYDARYPCFSLGRNLYYSVVYTIQSQYPGFPEQLVRGLAEISARDPVVYTKDEQLGFHVERFVPFPLRERFRRMVGGSATATGTT